ncbi:MAG: hypothetical protein Q9195_005563 [Heterodermia aff. obscurata]
MYIKSILLLALATSIASADVFTLGTRRVSTSLALSGTFLAGVLSNVPAGVDAVIIPRHGKKSKQSNGSKAAAASGTAAAAAKHAAATGTVGGGCNGTAAAAGNAQGNNKRAYGLPIYPRHKGQKKGKHAANGACGAAAASGFQGVAAATVAKGQAAAAVTGTAKGAGAA